MWRHVTGCRDQSPSDAASCVRTTETRTPLTRRIRSPPLPTHLQKEYKMVDKAARTLTYVLDGGVKVKGKAVPLQAWSGPEGSRKLRFPDYVTTAQDGGKVVSLTHRPPSPPGNTPGAHFC
jgi:hypothetical protein